MLNWDLGIFNPDRIYPVTPGLGLSEVNAVAIVIDESCPQAPSEQESTIPESGSRSMGSGHSAAGRLDRVEIDERSAVKAGMA
jgi:hypothetical protein